MLDLAREGGDPAPAGPPRAPAGPARAATGIAGDDGVWSEVPPPFERYGHTAIYDPLRDRMVVFGGNDGRFRADVWAVPLTATPAWGFLAAAGAPPPGLVGHTAVYDPVRDRMVVFGGYNGVFQNDVRALSLAGDPTWSAVIPVGARPTGRFWHSAIYDPVRDRMVVFGGTDGARRNDVWALELEGDPVWSQLIPDGDAPSARFGHAAIYDPARDRMVVLGGADAAGYRNDVWALSFAAGATWDSLAPAGTPPSGRYFHAGVYDPAGDGILLLGGYDGVPRDDLWALSLDGGPAWTPLTPPGTAPPGRSGHAAVLDPVRERVVMVAGDGGASLLNDVWAVALAGTSPWTELIPAGGRPASRDGHSAIHDPVRDRVVIFGGYGPGFRNDVWMLSLAGRPAWSQLTPAGAPPSARYAHAAIYDPVRDRMLVFGGVDAVNSRNDVWALSLAGEPAWSPLATVGIPPSARFFHAAIHDPVRDRMVVFGGWGVNGPYQGDVWALSLAGAPAWSALVPSGGAPTGRHAHSAVYDPVRDRMVVFGGSDVGGIRKDAWALTLAGPPAWSVLAPTENPPIARSLHVAVYDPIRDRMVVFGGTGGAYLNNLWALSFEGTGGWHELAPGGTPPAPVVSPTATYDPVRDRMVVFGGWDGVSHHAEAWAVGWGATVSVPGRSGVADPPFALAPPRPNPSRAGTILEFELAAPARVELAIFDMQGRRIRRLVDGLLGAGRHVVRWPGDDDRGRDRGSGVFIVRLRAGDLVATRRAVRIRP